MAEQPENAEAPSCYLGCPVWTCRDWIGTVLDKRAHPQDLLRYYSSIFNTVEGNTLFYAMPPMSTIERWMAESADGFRFAMKFPKAISHERRLKDSEKETDQFLKILEALQDGDRLGPSFLQLPPSFNGNNFPELQAYLRYLPKDFEYAVEPRHESWFDKADNEEKLDELLQELGVNKVIFDSRALFSRAPQDAHEREAQRRKPSNPVRKTVTSESAFLRFVGCNDLSANQPWVNEWAPIINKWILEGRKPYLFAHMPNEAQAPFLVKMLYERIQSINPLLPNLPEFATSGPEPAKPEEQEQLDLF